MSDNLEEQDNFECFRESYSEEQTRIARQIEFAAFGHDLGLNGYTTIEQAQSLRDQLRLKPESSLLDIGAGRGWPGSHIARSVGCRLVSTDVPWDALLEAKSDAARAGSVGRHEVVNADARAMPFRAKAFDGIVHADIY
jgi:cyclopropane fatty-acyl-phospholipid synthase-like methyltransferase